MITFTAKDNCPTCKGEGFYREPRPGIGGPETFYCDCAFETMTAEEEKIVDFGIGGVDYDSPAYMLMIKEWQEEREQEIAYERA